MVSGRNQHSPLCSQRFIIGPMPFMTCHCLFNVAFRICHEKIEEMLRQYMLCQQIHPEEKIYIVTQLYDNYISLNQLKKTTCFGTLLQGIFGKSKLSLTTYKDPKYNNFQQFKCLLKSKQRHSKMNLLMSTTQ